LLATAGAFRGWFGSRGARSPAAPAGLARRAPTPSLPPRPGDRDAEAFSGARVAAANAGAARMLWRHALGAKADAPVAPDRSDALRSSVLATLNGALADRHFPRRPTLMPRLLAAVHDPNAAAARLAGIIGQDPVLTANVLRLANSASLRTAANPVDTLQTAILTCGTDGLQALAAMALAQPVFRAGSTSFGRLPALLWERTERAAAAAELYAQQTCPRERHAVQLVVLLRALGPLVVFRIIEEGNRRAPPDARDPSCAATVIGDLGSRVAARVARQWGSPPQTCEVLAALDAPAAGRIPDQARRDLMACVEVGELLGTVSVLVRERVCDSDAGLLHASEAGLPREWLAATWQRLGPNR